MTARKEDPKALELRAPPPRVTRLSRRSVIAVAATLAALILTVTLWSLERGRPAVADLPAELHNVDRISRAEGLDQLPADYSKLPAKKPEVAAQAPVLGPPLPGDLGAAMLRAQHERPDLAIPAVASRPSTPDPAAERARLARDEQAREVEAAAKAPLFFRGAAGDGAQRAFEREVASRAAIASGESVPPPAKGAADATTPGAGHQDEKREFLSVRAADVPVSEHRLIDPISPYEVVAGTVIPAALITGIDSDLPGQVLAAVTEPVYDSQTGHYLLIPQGSRLIGEYDSQVAFGQRRVLLVWSRLIFPDASSISLDRLAGVDAAGHAGLADGVDRHWRQLLAGAALSTLIGVGAELAAPDRGTGQGQVIVATRQSLQDSVNQVGQELTRKNVGLQPTLTIRPGYPLRVIVSKDLVLRPYQPLFVQRAGS